MRCLASTLHSTLADLRTKTAFRLQSSAGAVLGHLQMPLHPLQALQKTAKEVVIEVKRLCRTELLADVGIAPAGDIGAARIQLPR